MLCDCGITWVSSKAGTINRIIDNISINSTKMVIVTDVLIIDHFISVSVTLPYFH